MFVSRYPCSRRRIVSLSFYNPVCSDPLTFCHGDQLLRKVVPPFRTVIKYAWPWTPWCSRDTLLALSRFDVTMQCARYQQSPPPCNCRETRQFVAVSFYSLTCGDPKSSVTFDTALLKYIYCSVFTIHHAVVLFARAVLHLDLCIIPAPSNVGCLMNEGKGLAMLRIVGPCNREAMCSGWSRNWIF
jgi:hypothetical protein